MENIAVLWMMFKEWFASTFGSGIEFSTNEVFGEGLSDDFDPGESYSEDEK